MSIGYQVVGFKRVRRRARGRTALAPCANDAGTTDACSLSPSLRACPAQAFLAGGRDIKDIARTTPIKIEWDQLRGADLAPSRGARGLYLDEVLEASISRGVTGKDAVSSRLILGLFMPPKRSVICLILCVNEPNFPNP